MPLSVYSCCNLKIISVGVAERTWVFRARRLLKTCGWGRRGSAGVSLLSAVVRKRGGGVNE